MHLGVRGHLSFPRYEGTGTKQAGFVYNIILCMHNVLLVTFWGPFLSRAMSSNLYTGLEGIRLGFEPFQTASL